MSKLKGFERYRRPLEESLVEIEQYLQKTEESAEAVSPDRGLGRLSRMEAMQDQQLILEARRRKKCKKWQYNLHYSEWITASLVAASFAGILSRKSG